MEALSFCQLPRIPSFLHGKKGHTCFAGWGNGDISCDVYRSWRVPFYPRVPSGDGICTRTTRAFRPDRQIYNHT